MPNIYEDLGEKIRKYRKAKHYSTTEFAEKLNVSAGFINNIENGRNDVFKLELLLNILKELDLPLEELFQLKPINVRNISIDPSSNNIYLNKLDDEPDESIEHLNRQLNFVIRSYLTTISEYGCSKAAVDEISRSTATHFEVIRNLKKI